MIMVVRNPGCDRPLTPWSCETIEKHGRHTHILNKPEQLRGFVRLHRKEGTQNWEAGIFGPSVVACVPPSTQGCLCVLDSQDSCFSWSPWKRVVPFLPLALGAHTLAFLV